MKKKLISTLLAVTLLAQTVTSWAAGPTLLNVSYDPTRELYKEYDAAFVKYWKGKKGEDLTINESNGGSGKQARAVIDGLEADVVTLALAYDIDSIASKAKLLHGDWQGLLPNHSTPYTSTIVFLVRKGNPKAIKDWEDLVKPGVQVIASNPKTSGGARWSFLAAWGWALKKYKTEEKARDYVTKLYKNAPVLPPGARDATTTFAQRGIGDVLLSWENEAYLAAKELGQGQFEIVTPKVSILAEPPVALVAENAKRHGTTEVAKAYLEYLYSPEGQAIVAHNYYRPRSKAALSKALIKFPVVKLFTINQVFGGWQKAQAAYFADGGVFDQIYQPGR